VDAGVVAVGEERRGERGRAGAAASRRSSSGD